VSLISHLFGMFRKSQKQKSWLNLPSFKLFEMSAGRATKRGVVLIARGPGQCSRGDSSLPVSGLQNLRRAADSF